MVIKEFKIEKKLTIIKVMQQISTKFVCSNTKLY